MRSAYLLLFLGFVAGCSAPAEFDAAHDGNYGAGEGTPTASDMPATGTDAEWFSARTPRCKPKSTASNLVSMRGQGAAQRNVSNSGRPRLE